MVDMKSVNKLRKQMLESEFDDIEKCREGICERRNERFDDLRDYLAEPTPVEDMIPFG